MAASSFDRPPTAIARTFEPPAGAVIGFEDGDIVRVLGLPYAAAERFEPPRPVTDYASEVPFLAVQRSPASPQLSSPVLEKLLHDSNRGLTFSEHCQFLSITLPADISAGESLPVMVWIHGGSYETGAGDLDFYDPRALVTEQRVIVVAVTYRLAMLGYYGDGESIPANLGLLDQVAALQWVRQNIAAFGGDADAVTLFGQSAGADAILHLMISDGASGLFSRVIVQSAPLGIISGRSRMEQAMTDAVGSPPRSGDVSDVLALQEVAERAAKRFGLPGGMPFASRYGEVPLPTEALCDDAWRATAPHIDLLIGSTIDEAAMYLAVLPPVLRVTRIPLIGPLVRRAIVRPITYLIYRRGAKRFARRHREAGGSATVYRLDWAPPSSPVGAGHISDIPLLLGSREAWTRTALLDVGDWDELDRRGRSIRSIWAGFARTGIVATDATGTMRFERS